MYKNVIESYSGYIQLQGEEWWDEKTIDNSFPYTHEIKKRMLEDENVMEVIPRLESFALASGGSSTKGVMVMGIDPSRESLLSNIPEKLVKYHLTESAIESLKSDTRIPGKTKDLLDLFKNTYYANDQRLLSDLRLDVEESGTYIPALREHAGISYHQIITGEEGVWLGAKLASYLELSPGDTLVLLGQGYHGATAAGKYEIKGLIKLPITEISSSIVYLPYDIAQDLYNAGGNITSLVLHLGNNDDKEIEQAMGRLEAKIPPGTRIIDWLEMNEVIIQQMEADNISGVFMIGVLYLVIAFGIFGTVLMMTAERKREFGVLVAIGMQKKKLASIITYEMIYVGLLGVLIGSIICIPIILYGVQHPIVFKGELAVMMEEYDFEPKIVFETVNTYFLWQMFIVCLMVGVALVYPVRKILNLKVVNALRA